jgi:ferrous iron transport protein B
MAIKIALAGNPNSGKTTLFNALTGSNQFVGNWPGVTVEKKEGKLKGHKDVRIIDLPGIYSLSPYTLEEVVARNYLITERPDAILNIIDGTNLERNLYLTTQLVELGIPVVCAVNMMDLVNKNGDKLNTAQLARELNCKVMEISALKGDGVMEAAGEAVKAAQSREPMVPNHEFSGSVEHAIAHIEEAVVHDLPEAQQRWYAIKLFERDEKIQQQLSVDQDKLAHIEKDIQACEKEMDDDAESIITNERYVYISSIISGCCQKNKSSDGLTVSDKIDKVVTNRILALPIFALVMWLVYYISVTTVGTYATDWANDGVFGDGWHLFGIGSKAYGEAGEQFSRADQILAAVEEGQTSVEILDEEGEVLETVVISEQTAADAQALVDAGEPDPANYGVWVPGVPVILEGGLDAVGCADWLKGLVLDGIVAGVGAVLGFVPQMLVLFIFLAFLEACGYMARVAFIMDRIFRRFGLSGKSFIPILIGTGCGVPGVMASRTIENERDRRMTVMTTTFIPCGAKMPIIGLIAGAVFGGASWVAPASYFIGMAAIIVSGIILKKTRMFAGDPAPFVMELPAYHMPTVVNVLRSMWERGWSFIKKAGTIILLSTILVWFTSSYGFVDGGFGAVDMENSILAAIGHGFAWIFTPLGWGEWRAAVGAITGLVAKENVVGTFGILFGGLEEVAENGDEIWSAVAAAFPPAAALSFLVFNLLCAPCFAAMGAIKREMNNGKWFAFAIAYQCVFAWLAALVVYQIGSLIQNGTFGVGVVVAVAVVGFFVYMLVRKPREGQAKSVSAVSARG